jgi:nucleoside-diphosphate-sugar epimerase
MRIAITGHSAGIGQALSKILSARGHEIVGLSKRHGHNIRVTPKIADLIEPCDLFINNAQAGYAQTELLYAVWDRWQTQPTKHIWCISTMMTKSPTNSTVEGQSDLAINTYRNQKIALEDACYQLQSKAWWPSITVIRPGAVATQPGQQAPWPCADVDTWAKTIIDTFICAESQDLRVKEISLAPTRTRLDI